MGNFHRDYPDIELEEDDPSGNLVRVDQRRWRAALDAEAERDRLAARVAELEATLAYAARADATAPGRQPLPMPGKDVVPDVALGVFDSMLRQRMEEGIRKYGSPLMTHNGRDVFRDLFEEIIDAWQYAVQAKMEHTDLVTERDALAARLADLASLIGATLALGQALRDEEAGKAKAIAEGRQSPAWGAYTRLSMDRALIADRVLDEAMDYAARQHAATVPADA